MSLSLGKHQILSYLVVQKFSVPPNLRIFSGTKPLSLILSCNKLKLGVAFVHFALIRLDFIFIHFLYTTLNL